MKRGGRKGGLSDDDRAVWNQVARGVTPMTAAARRKAAIVLPLPHSATLPVKPTRAAPIPHDHALVPVPPGFRIGGGAVGPALRSLPATLPSPAERLRDQPVSMDARTHRDITRGKLRPEARIDLHGLTLSVAKAELTGFILSARASGRRLVLVITGKGKGDHGPLPTRSGALRHEVPHWLAMAPMAGAVMQVVPAHHRHGGSGAYYVWLRRAGR